MSIGFSLNNFFKKALIDNNVMTEQQAEDYYNEWDKIGLRYEHGDYLELFNKSKMLITDCSSFLGEYFLTENPVIHLISKDATPYNETVNQIVKYLIHELGHRWFYLFASKQQIKEFKKLFDNANGKEINLEINDVVTFFGNDKKYIYMGISENGKMLFKNVADTG